MSDVIPFVCLSIVSEHNNVLTIFNSNNKNFLATFYPQFDFVFLNKVCLVWI